MLGRTLEERCLVEQWLEFEAQHFQAPFCKLAINILLAPFVDGPLDHAKFEKSEANLGEVLIYDERLSKSNYLAGDFLH